MLFLFGTLLHPPLLEAVSGIAGAAARLRPARLPGWRVAGVSGESFPMLAQDPGAAADGRLFDVPDTATWQRLDAYEAVFGYTRVSVQVETPDGPVQAHRYVPETARAPEGGWQLDPWATRWGSAVTEAAGEVMDLLGQGMSPDRVGRLYDQILQRGASRARARAEGGGARPDGVVLSALRRPYVNYFSVEEYDIAFRRYDGSMSDPAERAIFMGGDVSIVLPYDPVLDQVLLIEQFRVGAFGRGDPDCWITEPVAGRIDPGETPETAARREAEEEAGLTITALHPVVRGYPSPGTTTEYFYVFVGLCDLSGRQGQGIGGLDSEAEDIRHEPVAWTDFLARLDADGYRLIPLAMAGHWLARNRDRLRAPPGAPDS